MTINGIRHDRVLIMKFGTWKLLCCHGQRSSFPMVKISSAAISCALLQMTSKVDKLPLETEPVARDNNTSWTYSTDNRSNSCNVKGHVYCKPCYCSQWFLPSKETYSFDREQSVMLSAECQHTSLCARYTFGTKKLSLIGNVLFVISPYARMPRPASAFKPQYRKLPLI